VKTPLTTTKKRVGGKKGEEDLSQQLPLKREKNPRRGSRKHKKSKDKRQWESAKFTLWERRMKENWATTTTAKGGA